MKFDICTVDGCNRVVRDEGLCGLHLRGMLPDPSKEPEPEKPKPKKRRPRPKAKVKRSTCAVQDCNEPVESGINLCSSHYARLMRGSSLESIKKKSLPDEPSENESEQESPIIIPEPQEIRGKLVFDDPVAEAERFREYCYKYLVVPDGLLSGRPLVIEDWQFDFIVDTFSADRAGCSTARKNGKSFLLGSYITYFLDPLYGRNFPNFSCAVTSLTGDLARELEKAIQMTIASSKHLDLADYNFNFGPNPKIKLKSNGSEVSMLNSGAAGGHGRGVDLALADEVGLMVAERQRANLTSLRNAVATKDGKYVSISIQGTSELFKEERELAQEDATGTRFRFREHIAPVEIDGKPLDPGHIDTWRLGNPGLGTIKSIRAMETDYISALKNPAQMRLFKRDMLNMPIEAERFPICELQDWAKCIVGPNDMPARHGPCYIGIDTGDDSSMTASAMFWPHTGRLEVKGAFPDTMTLEERGDRDGIGPEPYVQAMNNNELDTYDVKVTPTEPFIKDLIDYCNRENIYVEKVLADNYRFSTLKHCLENHNVGYWTLVQWEGGWKGGTEKVIGFRKAIKSDRVKSRLSLLMNMAISNSSVKSGDKNTYQLVKRTNDARIDPLDAATMAIAQGCKEVEMISNDTLFDVSEIDFIAV